MEAPLLRSSPALTHPATGVILAIDYGQKRIGLALSDELQVTSRPHATWIRTNRRRDLARLRELVREHGVSCIVVGLPLHLDGKASEMSEEAKRFAARLEKALGLPVEMMDERLSSWEAERATVASRPTRNSSHRASGRSQTKARASLDNVAAAIILRDYLTQARAKDGSRA